MLQTSTVKRKWYQDADGDTSATRIGFAFCLIVAAFLSAGQVVLFAIGKSPDFTPLVGCFLGFAFGGKVGQAFAEKVKNVETAVESALNDDSKSVAEKAKEIGEAVKEVVDEAEAAAGEAGKGA